MNTMGLTTFETIAIWSVLGIAVVGLLYALLLRVQILREDKGAKTKGPKRWQPISSNHMR